MCVLWIEQHFFELVVCVLFLPSTMFTDRKGHTVPLYNQLIPYHPVGVTMKGTIGNSIKFPKSGTPTFGNLRSQKITRTKLRVSSFTQGLPGFMTRSGTRSWGNWAPDDCRPSSESAFVTRIEGSKWLKLEG